MLCSGRTNCITIRNIIVMLFCGVLFHTGRAMDLSGITYNASKINIASMAADNQYLWIATRDHGLYRIEKGSYETRHYTSVNSSLAGDSIYDMVSASDGAVYIGTYNGKIGKFTGSDWSEIITFPSKKIQGLCIDAKGVLWAVSKDTGVYNCSTGEIKYAFYPNRAIFKSNAVGDMWVYQYTLTSSERCDSARLLKYNGTTFVSSVSMKPVCSYIGNTLAFIMDNHDQCWMGYRDTLIRNDGQSTEKYTPSVVSEKSYWINGLCVNKNDVMIINVYTTEGNDIVYLYDMNNNESSPFAGASVRQPETQDDHFTNFCADPTGGFWLANGKGDIFCLAQGTDSLLQIPVGADVLAGNHIKSIVEDRSGGVWVGTSGGIMRYESDLWTNDTQLSNTLSLAEITSMAVDSAGGVWAGFEQPIYSSASSCGLHQYTNGQWKRLFTDHFPTFGIAADKDGYIWTAEYSGVFRYMDTTRQQMFEKLESSEAVTALGTTVNCIAIDTMQSPWIGTGLGVKKYSGGQWIDDTLFSNMFSSSDGSVRKDGTNVTAIALPSDGSAWIGTVQGIVKYADGNAELIDTVEGKLPDGNITCIAAQSADEAWIGTGKGMVHFTCNTYELYNKENSALQDNEITAVSVMRNGDVWIGTRLGGLTILEKDCAPLKNNGQIQNQTAAPLFTLFRNRNTANRFILRPSHDVSGKIRFSIITLDGKVIRSINSENGAPIYWDGTDCLNRRICRGVYLGVFAINGKRAQSMMLTLF